MSFYSFISKLFPSRCREVPAIDGGVLLQQVRITSGIYLQHFCKPEPEGIFHIHRWENMRSFVLTGHFTEQRLRADKTKVEKRHRFLSTYTMTRDVLHRVSYWSPKCWTIFCFSGGGKDWGYFDEQFNYTPWDEYIPENLKVKSL